MLELDCPVPATAPARLRCWNEQALSLSAQSQEGQSVVEFAVTLPILLLVVTGILTFGVALNNYLSLTNATSAGARELAISRGATTDPCATAIAAVYAAPTLNQGSMSFSFVLNGTSYPNTVSCNSSSTTTGPAANLSQGSSAQVNVTYPCSLALFKINYAPGCTLQTQTTELVQ
jgi:Flp pilus assembly protein TadG